VRARLVQLAQRAGLGLKQTYEREGKRLRRRADGYAHAKQCKRLRRVLKCQRTVLGRWLREIERKLPGASGERQAQLRVWLERAWRICRQRPEEEKQGLIVGALAFPGNPYDGHTLAEQLEQSSILLQDLPGTPQPKTVLVDLGFRDVDAEVSSVHLIHRVKHKTLTSTQRRWLRRRQAIEPIIAHVKHDHGMRRCWLKG
jgi:transposase, IS5 family